MRFLLIPTLRDGTPKPDPNAAFDEATFVTYMKFNEEMHRAGVLVASEGLNPNAKAAHVLVSARGSKRTVLDGPFAETKELVAGFWMIDVKSREEAIEWALRCPVNPAGDEVIEVRPLTGATDLPPELVALIERAAPTWSAAFSGKKPA